MEDNKFNKETAPEIPNHWRHYYEKQIDRGWIDPDTLEPVVERSGKFKEIPELPIDFEALKKLRDLLLDLGIRDNNAIIADLYFELGRRSKKLSFYIGGAKDLFEIGTKNRNTAKTNMESFNEQLPIVEDEYINLASLLGKLTIADSDDKNKDESEKQYSMKIPLTFLYLQKRARIGSGFKLNDAIDAIENSITEMLENTIGCWHKGI